MKNREAYIVHIETSTTACSVAVSHNEELLCLRELNDGYSHSENLTSFIAECLKHHDLKFSQLNAIAVSKGPGSYTGLRIGVSTAKGLCFGLNIPLIAVNTLEHMAYGQLKNSNRALLCPMIDARRMEVYSAVYDNQMNLMLPVEARIIDEHSFSDLLQAHKILFFGDGALKCQEMITSENAIFSSEHIFPCAQDMVKLAFGKYQKDDFEDVAYFEPFYLKDFIAGPKKTAV